jgi:hypothetical protein
MVALGCPFRARTWAGLVRVDVGPHSLWAFLVLFMEGSGAELITLGLSPGQCVLKKSTRQTITSLCATK